MPKPNTPTPDHVRTIAGLAPWENDDPNETEDEKRQREAYNKVIERFNRILLTTRHLMSDDRVFGWIRGLSIVIVVLALVVGTFGIIGATQLPADEDKTLPVVASSAVVVVALLYAGFVNPLQTLERDVVFRRWSDMIVSTWVLEVAAHDAGPAEVELAGRRANTRFTQLATSYAATAAKATDAMVAMAGLSAAAAAQDANEQPTTISVTNPGDQSGTETVKLAPTVMATATGPGTLTFKAGTDPKDKLPDGLEISDRTGEIYGTPTKAGSFTPVITVTSDKEKVGSVTCSFTFTITEKPKNETPDETPETVGHYTKQESAKPDGQ